jgi:hypothetical protein
MIQWQFGKGQFASYCHIHEHPWPTKKERNSEFWNSAAMNNCRLPVGSAAC